MLRYVFYAIFTLCQNLSGEESSRNSDFSTDKLSFESQVNNLKARRETETKNESSEEIKIKSNLNSFVCSLLGILLIFI